MGYTYINYWDSVRLRNNDSANQARVESQRRMRDTAIASSKFQLDAIAIKRKEQARTYSEISANIQSIHQQTDAKARQIEMECRKELGNIIANFTAQMQDKSREINQLRRDQDVMKQRIQSIASDFNRYVEEQANKLASQAERAKYLCREYELILGKIKQLHPETFDRENYSILTTNLGKVKDNIQSGTYQAAIGLAQRNITLANRCYIHLIACNSEFESLSQAVYEKMEDLAARLYAAENMQYHLSIPEWSNGLFADIKAEFESVRENVSQALDKYDTEALREALIILVNLLEQFDQCIEFAHGEKQRSDCVNQTAVLVANAMKDNNYSFFEEDSGFLDGDEKNPIALKFESGYGTPVDFLVYCPDKSNNELGVSIVFETEEENDILDKAITQSIVYRLGLENIAVQNNQTVEQTIQAGIVESEQRRNSRKDELKQKMDEKKQEDLKDVTKLGA